MKNIVKKIHEIDNLYHAKGCTEEQLNEAKRLLNISFPEEYVDYVKEFGVISFYGTEWTGLNVDGYLNVVEATMQERKLNTSFPLDCFVIENQYIDGLITVMDDKGHVFTVHYDKKELLCDSLEDYLEICIERGNK